MNGEEELDQILTDELSHYEPPKIYRRVLTQKIKEWHSRWSGRPTRGQLDNLIAEHSKKNMGLWRKEFTDAILDLYSSPAPDPLQERISIASSSRRSTLTERLKEEKQRIEERLEQLNTALTALEKNPEIQEVFDIISRIV